MEENRKLSELIIAFLSEELSPEDERFVINWINSSEANKRYFLDLQKTWNLLLVEKQMDAVDVDMEWQKFQCAIKLEKEQHCSEELEAGISIYEAASRKKIPGLIKIIAGLSIAASTLFVVLNGLGTFSNSSRNPETLTVKDSAVESIENKYITEVNTSGKDKLIRMADGTEILLSDGSLISFRDFETALYRHITLIGKGYFKVVRDTSRPLTVYSGNISTTALGTAFSVSTQENPGEISVRLYEGRIVVKSLPSAQNQFKKDFYLKVGEELVYNSVNSAVSVRNFVSKGSAGKQQEQINIKQPALKENPDIPDFGDGSWFMFNNQPLWQVFDELEEMYNVDISYDKKDLEKNYFIGTFRTTDSLDVILKKISQLNNLKIIKENNTIIIRN